MTNRARIPEAEHSSRTCAAGLLLLLAVGAARGQVGPLGGDPAAYERNITSQDYLDFALEWYREPILPNPRHGTYGPRHGLTVLAQYHFTKDPELVAPLLEMVADYGRWLREQTEQEKFHVSMEGAYLLGFYYRELKADGCLSPADQELFREIFLRLAEYHTSWGKGHSHYRGTQHRAQAEGVSRGIAAHLYPDYPQAEKWREYSEAVWGDWWNYRDIGINDTSYFAFALERVMLGAEILGRTEMWTDPDMKRFWDRLLYEITADGAVIPYGCNSGWNDFAGRRILALELAARYTRDGRYRWGAQRLMQYLLQWGLPDHFNLVAYNVEALALASILADDSVAPVPPEDGARVLRRQEILRLWGDEVRERFPDHGGVDVAMVMSERQAPYQIIFRSGWEPGGLHLALDVSTRHEPLNPTAILGLSFRGAVLGMVGAAKHHSLENRVAIRDLSGQATFCGRRPYSGEQKLPVGYAGMETTVEALHDSPLATWARVRISNYMGFETEQTREVFFVKNRFVLVRDESTFGESFPARLGATWNAHRVESAGEHWVNTYFEHTGRESTDNAYFLPRWDLLVYHSPQPGRRLEVEDTTGEAREPGWPFAGLPFRTQYLWEGEPGAGERVRFAQLLLPHDPAQSGVQAAAQVQFVADNAMCVAVRVESEPEREEWVLLNPEGRRATLRRPGGGTLVTDARCLYLDWAQGRAQQYWSSEGRFLQFDGIEVFRREERGETLHRR